jgi:hypothetical protein
MYINNSYGKQGWQLIPANPAPVELNADEFI